SNEASSSSGSSITSESSRRSKSSITSSLNEASFFSGRSDPLNRDFDFEAFRTTFLRVDLAKGATPKASKFNCGRFMRLSGVFGRKHLLRQRFRHHCRDFSKLFSANGLL